MKELIRTSNTVRRGPFLLVDLVDLEGRPEDVLFTSLIYATVLEESLAKVRPRGTPAEAQVGV